MHGRLFVAGAVDIIGGKSDVIAEADVEDLEEEVVRRWEKTTRQAPG
jgi:hypothetical protein